MSILPLVRTVARADHELFFGGLMITVKSLSMKRAEQVAKALFATGKVTEVYVFGSTARGENGEDLDIIATVSQEDFEAFLGYLNDEELLDFDSYSLARERYYAAGEVLGWDEVAVYNCYRDTPLDIFLFPVDWLGKQNEVHAKFAHEDPMFTRNIANDARRFDASTGEFAAGPAYRETYTSDGVQYTYSLQFGCPAIIIEGPMDADKVVAKARELGATNDWEEPGVEDFVIEFRHDPSRLVGPEVYTEEALRGSLAHLSS